MSLTHGAAARGTAGSECGSSVAIAASIRACSSAWASVSGSTDTRSMPVRRSLIEPRSTDGTAEAEAAALSAVYLMSAFSLILQRAVLASSVNVALP